MMLETVIFYLFASLAVIFALVVILHPDPVKATLSMVITLFSLAVIYLTIKAPLIAALQILLYTGAILVLFLFVIMLLNIQREISLPFSKPVQLWGSIVSVGFLIGIITNFAIKIKIEESVKNYSLVLIAESLFKENALSFIATGFLLLAAVVGATIIATKVKRG